MNCGNLRASVSTPSLDFPRRELAFREERGGFSLILKRNCSISPAGLLGVFAGLAGFVLAVGVAFAAAGAWLVLPFAGLEIALLGAAFVAVARHATDYEKIELRAGRLTVEVGEARRSARYELPAGGARVRVEQETQGGARVWLRAAQQELEIGRHLDAHTRARLASELATRLRY